ncbi:hypothetical protein CFSAN002368_27512 [Clostridium botulinum A1 str. CFSAN002368]|nr:hypothetical protein CFSAN002368_27512 [Clostridium botulinum A1 str. CFSAN002368]
MLTIGVCHIYGNISTDLHYKKADSREISSLMYKKSCSKIRRENQEITSGFLFYEMNFINIIDLNVT